MIASIVGTVLLTGLEITVFCNTCLLYTYNLASKLVLQYFEGNGGPTLCSKYHIYILILDLTNLNMIETIVEDYAAYFKLDVLDGFRTVQDVVDNMLTRLEELTAVLQMIKLKNSDCSVAITEDISKYRSEVTTLSKKITTLSNVIIKLQSNVDLLEKQVEKAELDFGVNNDNKVMSFFKPFLKKKECTSVDNLKFEKLHFQSVMNNFEDSNE